MDKNHRQEMMSMVIVSIKSWVKENVNFLFYDFDFEQLNSILK